MNCAHQRCTSTCVVLVFTNLLHIYAAKPDATEADYVDCIRYVKWYAGMSDFDHNPNRGQEHGTYYDHLD